MASLDSKVNSCEPSDASSKERLKAFKTDDKRENDYSNVIIVTTKFTMFNYWYWWRPRLAARTLLTASRDPFWVKGAL